jgi:hypothetical protein
VVALLAAGSPLAGQELTVTRVRLDSLGVLTQLARAGFEVAGVERLGIKEYALVVATASQRAALGMAGLAASAAPAPAAEPPVHFRDLAEITALLEDLAARGRIVLDTIGASWEGRPLLAAKLGPNVDAPDRPNVLYLGAHHAREWVSTEMALRLLQFLADSLPATPAGAALLAARDVWVIPVVNPDGLQYAFDTERLWRKNRRPNGDGTAGVDLNRNYPAFWGRDDVGSSGVSGTETYRGAAPASEPETRAVVAFHATHPPATAISYHSYSDLVLYPYGHRSGALAPDGARFRALAGTPLAPAVPDRVSESVRTGYHPGPAWQLYPTNGEYTEWAYRAHGTMAFTVELTSGCCAAGQGYGFLFPDDSLALATVFADNLPFALAVLQGASDPGPPPAEVEVLWPEVWLTGPPGPTTRQANLGAGSATTTVILAADSLDRGAARWRWRGALGIAPQGVRVQESGLGVRAEVVHAAGAEGEAGWTGWVRDSVGALEGQWYWRAATDTLRSPELSLAGLDLPRVAFWIRHRGSLFTPERTVTLEMSIDDGRIWTALARVAGAGDVWYPVTVDLPGVARIRLRFVAAGLVLDLDAIHVFGTPAAPAFAAEPGELGVSENPVRSTRVFFTWAAAAGDARLSVFTFTGSLVYRGTAPGADGQVAWDLTTSGGVPVVNGAYVVVLEVDGQVLRRRLFITRAP